MAANTDLVRAATPNFATTLSGSMTNVATSLGLASATGLSTATGITLVIDATDPTTGVSTPTLKEVVTGTLSGTTVSNLTRGLDGTSAQAHASGANVVMWITANMWNDFGTAYLVGHTQLGAHAASLSLTTPVISAPTISGGGSWTGSPNLSTPTIADLSNMTHTHANGAGGGTLGTSALNNTIVTADKLATGAANNIVATSETTTSTTYADLSTTGPSVTVTIGANGLAWVSIYANFVNDTATARSIMGYAVSGASTIASTDTKAVWIPQMAGGGFPVQAGIAVLLTGLTAGSTTFKAQYRVTSGTGTFMNRTISVLPL